MTIKYNCGPLIIIVVTIITAIVIINIIVVVVDDDIDVAFLNYEPGRGWTALTLVRGSWGQYDQGRKN